MKCSVISYLSSRACLASLAVSFLVREPLPGGQSPVDAWCTQHAIISISLVSWSCVNAVNIKIDYTPRTLQTTETATDYINGSLWKLLTTYQTVDATHCSHEKLYVKMSFDLSCSFSCFGVKGLRLMISSTVVCQKLYLSARLQLSRNITQKLSTLQWQWQCISLVSHFYISFL